MSFWPFLLLKLILLFFSRPSVIQSSLPRLSESVALIEIVLPKKGSAHLVIIAEKSLTRLFTSFQLKSVAISLNKSINFEHISSVFKLDKNFTLCSSSH